MYLFSVISVVILISFLFLFLSSGDYSSINGLYQLLVTVGLTCTFLSTVLLGNFLRHFGHDSSPFGKCQSIRLVIAGILYAFRAIIDSLVVDPVYEVPLLPGNSQILVSSEPNPDLKVVVMVVFLICLAMVIRYGNALKEDSDSIA